jgi:anaerobic selenocysteine-containing dehydrogenase
MRQEKLSFCRFCHAFCGIKVAVEDGRTVKVKGDVDNPLYRGFTCVKGRALPDQHYHPARLLHSMKRGRDGDLRPIPVEQAMDEIASRLTDIVDESGPRAVALYKGTYSFMYQSGAEMSSAFLSALGSPMKFSSSSIDQPGKSVAKALHGMWNAGPQPFSEADTWLVIGANPTVSMWGGIPQYDPKRRLREAKNRGMKLVVIDPRKTEAAVNADVFLQPRPGEDPTILAGILRVILVEQLHDRQFVADEVEGLESLRVSVEPFTPEYVEARAKVPAEDLVAAARMFASGKRGSVTAGTGPNMAPRGTLSEYLIVCIQTLCGRWLRSGERVPNPFVMMPLRTFKAQADSRPQAWGYGEQLRVRGLGDNASGMPTSALADEILLEGPGRVRALISFGGNPLVAWPDQLKTYEALQALDLLVTIDIKMSATAKMADYIIAPKLSLESDAITLPNERVWGYAAAGTGFPEPYAMFAPAVVDPPAGADVIEEWEFFYGLARRMGLQLSIGGLDVDMDELTTDGVHQLITRTGRVPLDEVKHYPHGHIFSDPSIVVLPKEGGWPHRFDVGNPYMMEQLREVAGEPLVSHAGYRSAEVFGYRLVSRRMLDVYNSSGRDIPHLVRKYTYNPAFMNPADMDEEGFRQGDVIEIDSGHAQILGIAEPEDGLARGVISMSHAWGDAPKYDRNVGTFGSNTGRLANVERDFDPVHGMPIMSAIPVNVRLADDNAPQAPKGREAPQLMSQHLNS